MCGKLPGLLHIRRGRAGFAGCCTVYMLYCRCWPLLLLVRSAVLLLQQPTAAAC